MITNPAASQKETESADTQEFMRMINDARASGLSQASGAGFAQIKLLDADDSSNPDQALLDNPHLNVSDQMGMAAFDLAVRGAISAKFNVQIQNKQFHDEFSMTGGGGSLKKYFEQMFEEVDENGNKKDGDKWDGYVEAHERIREQREEQEREEWGRSQHSYAGMTMTGVEWLELSEKLKKGEPLQQWLVEEMRKNGEEDPEGLAELVRLKMQMQGTPEKYWNEEQKQADAYLDANPTTEKKVAEYTAIAANHDVRLKAESNASLGGINPAQEVYNNPSMENSVDAGADLFASAPSLTQHYQAAVIATKPLDSKSVLEELSKPAQIAAVPAPGGGFDV